ncbi:MAG: PilN domain-containing protein [Gaiellaceae bacterium]
MRAVNLLPREARGRGGISAQQLPVAIGCAVTVLVVAVLSFAYLSASAKVAAAQQDLAAARAQLAAMPAPSATPEAPVTPPAVAAEEQPRLQAVSAALSTRVAWDRILREFSLVLPTDVWLTSLSMSAPAAGAAALGTGLTFDGSTYSYESVARLLSRLALIPDLTGVTLQSTAKNGRLVSFAVSAAVKGAPAATTAPPPSSGPTTTTTTTTTANGASS